jgi:hypothetical protein
MFTTQYTVLDQLFTILIALLEMRKCVPLLEKNLPNIFKHCTYGLKFVSSCAHQWFKQKISADFYQICLFCISSFFFTSVMIRFVFIVPSTYNAFDPFSTAYCFPYFRPLPYLRIIIKSIATAQHIL